MKIGFFGGSFNPITNAHINLAIDIVEKYKLDKVIFVPVGNYYQKENLIDEKYRFDMIKLAVSRYSELEVSDIELNQKEKIYAKDIFAKLKNIYAKDDIYFIIGADNVYSMILWQDFENIVKNYKYIVIQRGILNRKNLIEANETLKKYSQNFNGIENKKYNDFSATVVREKIKNNNVDDIYVYIPEEVYEYIQKNKLYKK